MSWERNEYNLIKKSGLFDKEYYLKKYSNARKADMDPLSHFIRFGWEYGQNPSPYFDTNYYIATYSDVKTANINPLTHFLLHGWKEGRNPSPYFDTDYYIRTYQDIRNAGINPLIHFIQHGWKEGRNPSPYFDTNYYLEIYPDVKESKTEPLAHYILFGKLENRKIKNITEQTWHSEIDVYEEIYNDYIKRACAQKSKDYVSFIDYSESEKLKQKIKAIAFYLPQFYPFPENDMWWGKGFTEWRNTSKAAPQFMGHDQPHLPGELGFYDLRVSEVQERQVELAKNYGIYGFCFHYYWFDGKRLLDIPLDQFINNQKINFPFCLCWANENWTRRWDGLENDILIAQTYTPKHDIEFIADLQKYILHKNYIRIDNRALLIIYRSDLLPNPLETTKRWRNYARESGWGELFILAAQTFGQFGDPRAIGFDGAVEFPPHNNPKYGYSRINSSVNLLNPTFQGNIYDYKDLIHSFDNNSQNISFPLFKTVSPSWDNEPRRPTKGNIYAFASPNLYQKWLSQASSWSISKSHIAEPVVFINAWNEWGEGAYLEPDQKYGYAYLQATHDVLRSFSISEAVPSEILVSKKKPHDVAVILHLYYVDLWEKIKDYLLNLGNDYDLFVSIPDNIHFDSSLISEFHSDSYVYRFENRGRDVAPFLKILPDIANNKYKYAIKLHTKKTVHRTDGINWFEDIFNKILGTKEHVSIVKTVLSSSERVGIIAPKGHVLPSSLYWGADDCSLLNIEHVTKLARKSGIDDQEFPFVAGSMFWFKPDAFKTVLNLSLDISDFEPELGQKDGTLAHAFERFFGLQVQHSDYGIYEIDQNGDVDRVTFDDIARRNNYAFATATKDGKPFSL